MNSGVSTHCFFDKSIYYIDNIKIPFVDRSAEKKLTHSS